MSIQELLTDLERTWTAASPGDRDRMREAIEDRLDNGANKEKAFWRALLKILEGFGL